MGRTEQPGASDLCEGLGPLVEAAGMVNLLNHGAASCVHSEGCNGVTQEHLERFAKLVRAAERERCASICDGIGAGYTAQARRQNGQHATHAAGQRDGANECAAEIRRGPNDEADRPGRSGRAPC